MQTSVTIGPLTVGPHAWHGPTLYGPAGEPVACIGKLTTLLGGFPKADCYWLEIARTQWDESPGAPVMVRAFTTSRAPVWLDRVDGVWRDMFAGLSEPIAPLLLDGRETRLFIRLHTSDPAEADKAN